MLVFEQEGTITTSSGSGFDTILCSHYKTNVLLIIPTTSTTKYDIKITNDRSFDVFTYSDVTGTFNEVLDILIRGNATLTIESASADEAFSYYISAME